ncbi:hypothetical protein FRC01_009147 [Tulasnella sp. 417]|nr:hypothetical protein FRC01_009147 [Tulasnella sp. 417]
MTSRYTTPDKPARKAKLEEVEQDDSHHPAFILSRPEVKLLAIAGVGFFLDAYDLFVINPVATMLQYRLYDGHSLPTNLEGFVKAGANIGSVIGQFLFGYLADAWGRKAVYGKELELIIVATTLCLTTPTGSISPDGSLIYLGVFRILLGIGVGGDYPMSASVTSDRAKLRKRGTMLAYIFSNQGWGSFMGSIIFMIVLQCYHHVMEIKGEVSKVDGVWRIVVGASLIPAFGTLYQRLRLPEAARYEEAQKMADEQYFEEEMKKQEKEAADVTVHENPVPVSVARSHSSTSSENATVVHTEPTASTADEQQGQGAKAAAAAKKRQWKIQFFGFLMEALFLGIMAGRFYQLSKPAFIVNFALLQFFFNFGANSTTYIYPAEVFPTRFKGFAHGVSAASGKAGAIISALAFNSLSHKIGTPAVLWIFFGCSIGGALFTLLLPEVKMRDPDIVYEEEEREKRKINRQSV